MSTLILYPDTEGAVRTWLRTVPELTALIGNRVFMGLPKNVTFPCISLFTSGPGGVDVGETPLSWELIHFDCWGQGQNKRQARQVSDVLKSALEQMPSGILLDANTRSVGARIFNSLYSPDPDNAQARYVVMAYVMASSIA